MLKGDELSPFSTIFLLIGRVSVPPVNRYAHR